VTGYGGRRHAGGITRVRGIDPDGRRVSDDRGYMDVPVTAPLSELDIARRLPTLPLLLGQQRSHVNYKIREYVRIRRRHSFAR
jgi:hypothetical protein